MVQANPTQMANHPRTILLKGHADPHQDGLRTPSLTQQHDSRIQHKPQPIPLLKTGRIEHENPPAPKTDSSINPKRQKHHQWLNNPLRILPVRPQRYPEKHPSWFPETSPQNVPAEVHHNHTKEGDTFHRWYWVVADDSKSAGLTLSHHPAIKPWGIGQN